MSPKPKDMEVEYLGEIDWDNPIQPNGTGFTGGMECPECDADALTEDA